MHQTDAHMDLNEFIPTIISFVAGGGLSAIATVGLTRREKELDNKGKDLDNASKIIDEYQAYIDVLKQEREVLKQERTEAIRERDEYKAQVQALWEEVNSLKRKLANLESNVIIQMSKENGNNQ